jgi:hypothetical protein
MAIRAFRDEPDIWSHKGFLLAEDEMLKEYLTGIAVPGREPAAPKTDVGVWFRWPEGERQIKYPFITIDLLQAEPAFDLFTSDYYPDSAGRYRPSVSPTLPSPPGGWGIQDYNARNYLPFRLMYQVGVHARNALHDRYLQSIFKVDVFPPRPFWIQCPADQVWRRTELMNATAADLSETTESGTKRIFRKVYTVNVLAEIPQDRIEDSWVYKALRVFIPVTSLEEFDAYYQQFLVDQPDPLGDFTDQERTEGGELAHVYHQGQEMPSALPHAPGLPGQYGSGPYGSGPYGGTP